MEWLTFWESVAVLRRIELVTLVVTLVVPLISGSVLLTLRHRIKSLQHHSTEKQGAFFDDKVGRLEEENRSLAAALAQVRREAEHLGRLSAPRQLSAYQTDLLLDKLRGVRAAPVLVAAYAFEEESHSYATQIAAVLRKAGWDVSLNKASMNDFKGVSLGTFSQTHQSAPGLHELSQAFADAQLELHPREIRPDSIPGQIQEGSLLVVVGRK